jgi:hypothetical protein
MLHIRMPRVSLGFLKKLCLIFLRKVDLDIGAGIRRGGDTYEPIGK